MTDLAENLPALIPEDQIKQEPQVGFHSDVTANLGLNSHKESLIFRIKTKKVVG